MKLNTQEEIGKLIKNVEEITEGLDINIETDIFEIIQPYKNGQRITLKIDDNNDGDRVVKINVYDSTYILPKIDRGLDVFI